MLVEKVKKHLETQYGCHTIILYGSYISGLVIYPTKDMVVSDEYLRLMDEV